MNEGLGSVYSEIADTWLVMRQNEEENSSEEEHWQEKVGANAWDEEFNDEDIEHIVPLDMPPLKRRIVSKPCEKKSFHVFAVTAFPWKTL